MGSIVLLLILFVVLVALVAYVVVGALEMERTPVGVLTYEGVITERVDCVDGGTRLWLRVDEDDTILEIAVYDATMPAGLRAGQRVRVQGRIGEVPDVLGAIVDLREPPQNRRIVRATAIHRIDPLPPRDLLRWRGIGLGVGGYALLLLRLRRFDASVFLILTAWISYAMWSERR